MKVLSPNQDTRTYHDKLEEGERYQDFITQKLYPLGIILIGYSSQKSQYENGENMLGMEIKLDLRWPETGNLYLETHEKTHRENTSFVESGINRLDNSWLYLIGNYDKAWIFPKTYLPRLASGLSYKTKETPTSKGVLMPLTDADKYAARTFQFTPRPIPIRQVDEVPF